MFLKNLNWKRRKEKRKKLISQKKKNLVFTAGSLEEAEKASRRVGLIATLVEKAKVAERLARLVGGKKVRKEQNIHIVDQHLLIVVHQNVPARSLEPVRKASYYETKNKKRLV